MYNAAISPLAAAAGIDNGKLLSVPAARKLFFALLQENHRILSAAGIELGKVGPFHPSTVAWILRRKWLAGLMAKFFEPSLRGTYCSMAGEIQKGRTEIDNYNGHLLRLAERTGTPCPLNRAVFDLVMKMTAEQQSPRLEVFDALPTPSLTVGVRQAVATSSLIPLAVRRDRETAAGSRPRSRSRSAGDRRASVASTLSAHSTRHTPSPRKYSSTPSSANSRGPLRR